MKLYFIPIASVLLQFLATFIALRLIWVTERIASWIIIAGAILLMAFRRCISLYDWFFTTVSPPPLDITFEIFGLCISALMAVGLLSISPLFYSIRRSLDLLRQQHQLILNSAGEGIFGLDLEGKVTFVNPAAASLSGYQAEELMGRNSHDLLHYAKADGSLHLREECPIYATLKDAVVHRVAEDVFWRKDGQSFPVEYTATPTIENNRIIGTTVVFKDITARKKQEDDLRQSEEHYRGLITNGSDMISVLQVGGTITYVSPSVGRILGYGPEEIIGTKACHLLHPEDVVNLRKLFDEAVKEKDTVYVSEYRMRHKDGSWRFFESMGKNLLDHPTIAGIVINSRDVTDRKIAEEALRLSEERFQLALRGANDGLWDFNLQTNEVYYSPRWKSMLGYGEAELADHLDTWKRLVHPADRDSTLSVVSDLIAGAIEKYEVEFRMQHKDGHYFTILSRGFLVRDMSGKAERLVGTHVDITERKQAEDALRESERHYRSLFDNMLNGFAYCQMIFDQDRPKDFIYLEVNDAFEVLTGLKDVSGKKVSEVIPGIVESDPELLELYGRVALTGTPSRFETFVKALDIWFSIAVYCPHPGYFVAIFEVITERKRAEEELAASERRYRELVELSPDAIYIQTEGKIAYINRAGVELFGAARPEELLSLPVLDRIHPDFREVVAERIELLRDKITSVPLLEEQYLRLDGSVVDVEVAAAPLDYQGKPGAQVMARDITERKRALQEIESLAKFPGENPNPVLRIDRDGAILYANQSSRALLDLWGCQSSQSLPYDLRQLVLESSDAKMIKELEVECGESTLSLLLTPVADRDYVNIYGKDITERKQMEKALSRSEEKYRLVADFNYDWEYWTGPDGRLIYVSPSCQRITGYRAEEFLANPDLLNDLAHPDDRAEVVEHTREVMQDGTQAGHLEFRIITRNGEQRWINHYCQAVYGSDGTWLGRRASNRDATERKLAEIALRETNETLQAVFQAAPVAINFIDLQGNVRIWSRASEEIFGWSAAEVLGKPLPHVAPGQQEGFRSLCKLVLQGEPCIGAEVQRRRKDGSTIDVNLSAAPVHDAQGNIMGSLGILMDISQRKRAEEAFKNLVSYAPMGIFIVQDGKFVMTNPGLQSITGYPAQEMLGDNSLDMVIPEHKAMVRKKVIESLEGQNIAPIEFQFTTRSGEVKWAMEKVAPTQYEGKRAVLGYFMDITPHKQLEAQFLQAQKMEAVGRLAGGVAHDFNNMLAAIMGYADMMQLDLSPENPLHHQAEAIKKASERAASLTRQLLAFSRKQVQQAQILNLNTVIGEMDKMLRRLIDEDITLNMDLEPGLAAVKADPGQMEQILMNLVVNARDAMPSGGRITIKTANVYLDEAYIRKHSYATPGPYVSIAVGDNGVGMDAETQARIFEPFFTTKEVGKGTGLGLSTVYGIVKQSQGSIEVYSELGIGTTLKVYLPRVDADVIKAGAEATSDAGLQGTETILVVEDEELLRELICASLKKQGYGVLGTRNGLEALALCEEYQGPIHLMLTDVVMPNLNGRELAERVPQIRPEMKVLLMSGYTEDVIIRHGVLDETMHFIEKPFTASVLLRTIRELLSTNAEG